MIGQAGLRRGVLWGLFALAVALALLWVLLGKIPPVVAAPGTGAARTYAEAIARFDSLRALDDVRVNPRCHPRLLTSGARTEHVIVLLHGFTNCPKQFDPLAERFARLGYNVLVPRLPRHGIADRMTEDLGALTAEDLVRAGEDAVAIAQGLGEHVTVAGLSSGAVLGGWLARYRTDIERAVLIAPAFAPHGVPAPAARRLTGALLQLPNLFLWWDPRSKENLPGPRQTYPRFASHALAEVYRLGFEVLDASDPGKPAAKVVLVTSAADEVVNNDLARELARRWRARGADVRTFEFPDSLDVRHDMIDPEQPYQRTPIAYPVLEKLVVGGTPSADME